MKDTASLIRNEIKGLGFGPQHVSVKASRGSAINVTIKTPQAAAKLAQIKEASEQHQRVRICQASGEVLAGGNTFVFVTISRECEKELTSQFIQAAQNLVDRVEKECEEGSGYSDNGVTLIKDRAGRFSLFSERFHCYISDGIEKLKLITIKENDYEKRNMEVDYSRSERWEVRVDARRKKVLQLRAGQGPQRKDCAVLC